MILSRRLVHTILIGSLAVVALALCTYFLVAQSSQLATVVTGVVGLLCAALLVLQLRGWEPARYVAIVLVSLGVLIGAPSDQVNLAVLLPPIFALALGDWRWVAGTGLAVLLGLIAKSGFTGPYLEFGSIASFVPTIGAAVIGSMAYDSSRIVAERNAQQAVAERLLAEQRSAEVSKQAEELNAQNARQRELLELVSTLETPAVSVAEGALLAPLVGSLDSRRADRLTRRLLEAVHTRRVRLVILDIAGVPLVDTAVAGALTATVRALRLLGCEVVLTGISATVATTLTTIGVSLDDLAVAASPQDALARYMGGS